MSKYDDQIQEMYLLMGKIQQERLVTDLPTLLIVRYPDEAQTFTAAYIEHLALTVYLNCVFMPYPILKGVGIIEAARMMLPIQSTSPEEIVRKMQDGFAQVSPTYAAGVTSEVVALASKLLMLDILDSPFPSEEELQDDTHFYFVMAMDLLGNKPDRKTTLLETLTFLRNANPDDLKEFNADLLDQLEAEFRDTDPDADE